MASSTEPPPSPASDTTVVLPSSPAPRIFIGPTWRAQSFLPLAASRQKSSPPPSPTTTEPAMVGRTSTACANVHGWPPASATPTTLSLLPATPTATSAPMAGFAEPIFCITAPMDAPPSSVQFVEKRFG